MAAWQTFIVDIVITISIHPIDACESSLKCSVLRATTAKFKGCSIEIMKIPKYFRLMICSFVMYNVNNAVYFY